MTGAAWLEIDIKGFSQILTNKGIARIALEPISNAFDTEATEIKVMFREADQRGWVLLTVTDDDPDGFADLKDAYTLFAPSKRRDDPTKRGRFGQGDKELLAVCSNGGSVTVESTTGTLSFGKDGRTQSRRKRESGTEMTASFRCTKAEQEEFKGLMHSLLIPPGISVFFNGEHLYHRPPVKTVQVSLPTKTTDSEGALKDTTRMTEVALVEPRSGEHATIYELGVPVVEHDGRWHINVGQKVPLNAARDNVTPSYLKRLREIMLNETYDLLTEVDMKKAWVTEALPQAAPEVMAEVIERIHGKDAVIYDPSNREASKRAVDEGRTVVYGRQFPTEVWNKIREHEILLPAGRVIETFVHGAPEGEPPIDLLEWTPGMHNLARYAQEVGLYLIGYRPDVQWIDMVNSGKHAQAMFGGRTITFNLRFLGKTWADTASDQDVDALLIHEFAHDSESDHFSDSYIHECCRLGALLRSCPASRRPA